MTPEAAIQAFLSGFLPSFAASSTPTSHEYPYATYTPPYDLYGAGETNMAVNLWFRTDSEAEPNAKVREIAEELRWGGVQLACDGGSVWVKPGSPFAQNVPVEGDDEKVKRRYLNLALEFNITG